MASIIAIRDGLATRLQTISGLRVADYVAGQLNPPFAVIIPGDPHSNHVQAINFDSTMGRGSDDFVFTLIVAVSLAHDRVAHEQLDAYLAGSGSKSIKAAIDGDGTLGGAAHFSNLASVRRYGGLEWAGQKFLGAEFLVEVCA